jgi:predicted ATPase
VYKRVITEILDRIFYLGPIREKPQGLYNVGFETIPKYVGISGAYFASVLLRENKNKNYILPNGEFEKMTLLEALDEWVAHLDVASQIEVEKKNSFGFSVSISNTQRCKSDIMNVGIGTSQVLPVLITGLLSEEREYLLFEQPELHLHPYSQSRLADFFVELVRNERRIIIETHSEYFVLRLRYQILKNNISEKNVVINFFQNKEGTKISQGVLSDYGNIQYPEDFRDETQKLLDDLLNAALEKRGQ